MNIMRTLDTTEVLSHASPSVRKLTASGSAVFTFPDHSTDTDDGLRWRKATPAEVKRAAATCTPEHDGCAACMGTTRTTLAQQAAESLRALRTGPEAWGGMSRDGFTAPTGKTVTPIGAWVTVDGRIGQVWSAGFGPGTVWVAMADGDYVETRRAVLADEPDVLTLDVDVPAPVDVVAAQDLAARAEATGRDGVAFVRSAMGDAAANALAAPAPVEVAPTPEPVERVVTDDVCALCGTPVDAVGIDTDGTVWCDADTRHVVACDAPRDLPIGQAVTYAAPVSGMLDQRLSATVVAHAVAGPKRIACTQVQASNGYTWWMRPVDLTPVQEDADIVARMNTLRRAHRHLRAWRETCASV